MKLNNIFIFFLASILGLTFASACNLNASLINQDPYPAVPGDYVKIVFQLTGVDNPDCKNVYFELMKKYPISLDPDDSAYIEVKSGIYSRDFSSYLIIPYKVRVDKDAIDGQNEIEVKFGLVDRQISQSKKVYIEVENVLADFEIHIDKYSYLTKELTFNILNIGENDIEALTLEIPVQDNIDIRGTNRVVVGDLDSNEYTTADYKADMRDGNIEVKILYTDEIGTRRELTKTVSFNSVYFLPRNGENPNNTLYYIIAFVVIVLIIWFIWKRRRNRQDHRPLHR